MFSRFYVNVSSSKTQYSKVNACVNRKSEWPLIIFLWVIISDTQSELFLIWFGNAEIFFGTKNSYFRSHLARKSKKVLGKFRKMTAVLVIAN